MRKNLISIIFAVIFITLMSSSVFASMAMPRYGVNKQTKECSEFFMGDECVHCTFPDGWQMIKESQCPTGYKEVQKNLVCTSNKNFFCCSVGHSGANGDCEDVVVNDIEQKCAFVEDINECEKLPENWIQAEKTEFGRVCPSWEYEWLNESLYCEAKIIEKNDDDKKDIINSNKQQDSNALYILGISAVIIILLIILWFFLIKRRQK